MNFDETVFIEKTDAPVADEATEDAPFDDAEHGDADGASFDENDATEAEENEKNEEKEETDSPDATDVAYLKAELESLKKELADTRSLYARLESECSEFGELYPEISLSSLPDSVWQSVKGGVPLAAAYALEARKAELAARRAGQINGENRKMSSGSLSSDSYNDFFTPSQVRAMSAAEVRANYTKIINSMSKWH